MNQPLLPVLPDCQHRGEQLPGWRFECSSNRIRHSRSGIAERETCAECPFADVPNLEGIAPPQPRTIEDSPDWRSCRHRGPIIRQRKADLCGRRGQMFPVFGCERHRECVLTRFCEKQPERVCWQCDDAEAAAIADVAVVVTTHNYARYLAQAIDSLFAQSQRPIEILVVDDASDDDPAAVVARYAEHGVRYLRVEERNVYRARARGYAETSSRFLVFLDADDWLGPEYLARGRAAFTDPAIGIAYTDLIDQPSGRIRHYPAGNIEAQNYIHAGAIVRRVAIDQSEAFVTSDAVLNTTADWYVWRRVMRGGWKATRFDGEYFYRQHDAAMHLGDGRYRYRDRAMLDLERVTIVLPLSGRDRFLPGLTEWVARQTWPAIELLVIDSSDDASFRADVRAWLAGLDCPTTFIPITGVAGLADRDRRDQDHFRAVQQMMPRIYRHLDRLGTEFALIVEEDVIPPADAIDRLMNSIDTDVAAVTGVYRSRWSPELLLVWDTINGLQWRQPRQGVEDVGGSGFGCLLCRRSALSQIVFHAGRQGNYDPNAAEDLRALGWRWRVDWSVHCVHDGIEV